MNREALDATTLADRLAARWPSVRVVDSTGSTNADLLAAAAAGAPDRSLLVAEVQTGGRGRFDRVWSSPFGAGLTFSALLRPTSPVRTWGWLPLLAGVALLEAVEAATGVPVELKWPNDLLARVGGAKLAGILVQSAGGAPVVGIGLNVSTTADELPVPTAGSLALVGGGADRTELMAAIASALDGWVLRWDGAGGDAEASGLATVYRRRCATLGRPVRVALADGGELVGTADRLGADGSLVVTTGTGERTVAAGDVEHLRPAQ